MWGLGRVVKADGSVRFGSGSRLSILAGHEGKRERGYFR